MYEQVMRTNTVLSGKKGTEVESGSFASESVDLAYKVLYEQYPERREVFDEKLVNSDWRVLCSSADVDTAHYSYKAVSFINQKTKEIHIASAGTKPDVNDLLDDARLCFDALPNKLEPAQRFLDKIIDFVGGSAAAEAYQFSTSGHSLGAIVSDLTGAEILSRGLHFNGSTTFENPGSVVVVQEAMKANQFTGTSWGKESEHFKQDLEQLSDCCTVYNAVPNFINSLKYPLAKKMNLVLPSVVEKEQIADTTQTWGSYLYNMVGNAAESCLEYLGIKKVVSAVSHHKLGNFLKLEQALVVPIESISWRSNELGQLVLELPSDHSLLKKLAMVQPTGSDVVIFKKTEEEEEEGCSLMDVKWGQYSFEDLRRAGFSSEIMETSQQRIVSEPICNLMDRELLNGALREGLSIDEGYSSAVEIGNMTHVMAAVLNSSEISCSTLPSCAYLEYENSQPPLLSY